MGVAHSVRFVGRVLAMYLSAILIAVAAAAALVVVDQAPAHAGACQYSGGFNTVDDYAYTHRLSGTCDGVKARHQYRAVWNGYLYWTSWGYGYEWAFSNDMPELVDSEHGYFDEA